MWAAKGVGHRKIFATNSETAKMGENRPRVTHGIALSKPCHLLHAHGMDLSQTCLT